MMTRRNLGLVLLAVLCVADVAYAQKIDNILTGRPLSTKGTGAAPETPESIISVQARLVPPSGGRSPMLAVTAKVKPGWHIYALTQIPIKAEPTTITVDKGNDYRVVSDFRANLPPHVQTIDGDVFEEHEGEVTWQAPIEVRPNVDPKTLKVAGKARIQTCREGACLQPHVFPFVATVVPSSGPSAKPVEVFADQNAHATLTGRLEPSTAAPGSEVKLVLQVDPAKGWHVYERADRDKGDLGYKPTLIVLTNTSGFKYTRPTASATVKEQPPVIPGDPPQRFHEGSVTWTTTITIPGDAKPGAYELSGLVGYQVCQDHQCDQPRGARFETTLTVGTSPTSASTPLAFSEARYIEAAKLAETLPVPGDGRALAAVQPASLSSLPMIILASLLGGLILNFMPCVLPVIGLKILSFAEQAGRSRGQILALNLWYSLGLLSVFLVLATLASGVNLGLREQNLGWGEQFSSTSFNVTMVAIVFVMALSFLGIWEIPIPGFVGSGAATEVAARAGPLGAFAKGVLTTVLATPCSGPLLGPVLGYTISQPPVVTYLIFACIGLGMASPYLLIGAFPRLVSFLPKPGAWMDTFKQMMGFAMLGTIIFFFSFMKKDYLVPTFALMVGLWAGCWWIGRTSLTEPLVRKLMAWGQGGAFAAIVGVAAFTWLTPHESIIPWRNFSKAELAKLTAEGNTVFVDFTAEWCPNCKWNLKFAIETNEVRDLIAKNNIIPLLADYTDVDGSPEIKKMLESLQSASIPLLAIYPAGGGEPLVLRDVISKQQLLDNLEKAGPSKSGTGSLTAAMP